MPAACLVAHQPAARTALVAGATAFATCQRCGAGLLDRGDGWRSAARWTDVLRRPALIGSRRTV